MTYNLSLVNASGMVSLTQGVNEVFMFHSLGILILLGFGIILFTGFMVGTKGEEGSMKKALGVTTLICAVLVIFLRNLSLVSDTAVFVTWAIAATAGLISVVYPD